MVATNFPRQVVFAFVLLLFTVQISAQELSIEAPENWRKEAIKLPPEFAPDMKLRGDELLRFSPGMFDKDSDQFFTYVFAIRSSSDKKLTKEFIQQELLTYYQGLCERVSGMRGVEADTTKFSIEIVESKTELKQRPGRTEQKRYDGVLDWIEPFATGKEQKLNFEIDAWSHEKDKKNYLFVCVSPTKPGDNQNWKQLRAIRSKFQ